MAIKRYVFSCPDADVSVQTWLLAQSNVSASLRTLIREAIRQYGNTDITCLPVEQRGNVGRPSYAELAAELETLRQQQGRVQTQAPVQTPQQTPQTAPVAPVQPQTSPSMPKPQTTPTAPPTGQEQPLDDDALEKLLQL